MIEQFMIDPPWPKKKGGIRRARPNQGRELDYNTLSTIEIFSLLDREVFLQAAQPHNVFLWVVDSSLRDAEMEMEKRGYRRHARLIWDKTNGVAPAFTIRFTHEYLLWYYKPKLIPVAKEMRGKLTTLLREKAREHSRKPDAAYTFIEALYPHSSYMDVFSREFREGWKPWGDECDYFSSTNPLHQLRYGEVESPGDSAQHVKTNLPLGILNSGDVGPGKAGSGAELLLGPSPGVP